MELRNLLVTSLMAPEWKAEISRRASNYSNLLLNLENLIHFCLIWMIALYVNRELKQPGRQRQRCERYKFAYLTTKNSSFTRFAPTFFVFVQFISRSRSFHEVTGPVRGFWYTVSGGLFIQQVYGTFFCYNSGIKYLFFPWILDIRFLDMN